MKVILPERFEKLQWFDVQTTVIMNPLNWSMGCPYSQYGMTRLDLGPISFMLFYGS